MKSPLLFLRAMSKTMVILLVLFMTIISFSQKAMAFTWIEVDDAGQLPGTAQIPAGDGPLEFIEGFLESPTDVDMYAIFINGDGSFSATTVGWTTGVDTQLTLYDSSGMGIYSNDDDDTTDSAQSTLPSFHLLTPTNPGLYYLAISDWDWDPVSDGGLFIFPHPDNTLSDTAVYGPTGPGGELPVIGWAGLSTSGGGLYKIALTGTATSTVLVSDFTANPITGAVPLTVQFTNRSTGDITEWYWDFDDGETSTEQNPSHIYNDVGNYTVSLTVSGSEGSDTETKNNYISVVEYSDFIIEPSQGTIDTELAISGWNMGEKKGKVLIGESKCKVLEWTNISVRCLIKKVSSAMGSGTYHVMVVPKGKGVEPIVLEDAFSIMAPDIQAVTTSGNSATITGSFFGTKKVKAYLMVDESGKRKKMKITSLEMNSGTGFSQLEVTVSNKVMKKLESGSYDVIVTNKVGSDSFTNGFTKE